MLFGTFGAVLAGKRVAVAPGNGATFIKLLILNDGRLTTDQAIDALWPDSDPDTGRRRLRNVLSRARSAYGPIVERSGEALHLDQSLVGSDFGDAHAAAKAALQPGTSASKLRRAIQLGDKTLLPDDRYEDWAEAARSAHERILAQLFGQLSAVHAEAGNISDAQLALQRALDLDPVASALRKDRLNRLQVD